ncbi:hypothetical protein NEOLEDRAFT_1071484 [Neolentinus lepideus HHB14362 ss-1]|uniref:Uncharacterized protein n=1 Tax=Neolentinus lepideus HHB14362 ss-1 TaxID=1314782 RepID=A0A165QIC7_9AGAM|nr:hypothetical protein NEOLEDRAFT_1071484 [Neolentinus lepideus HHB14362 ss-1]
MRDNASARMFSVPGTCSTLKSNSEIFSSQRACRPVRFLWPIRCIKPLWSVSQRNLAPWRMSLCRSIDSTPANISCSCTA